jgi:hypothetical protein
MGGVTSFAGLLLAFVPNECAVWAGDAEECLELAFVEIALWLVGGVVGHKVDDEVVGGWGDQNTGEWCGEVVRIGGLGDVLVIYVLLSQRV